MAFASTLVVGSLLVLQTALPAARNVFQQADAVAVRQGARISGAVWNAADEGVAGAAVRLRNVVTGTVEATATADGAGQFVFQGVEAGSYVIEILNANGAVTALGQSFAVGAGESVATFVRLGPKIPGLAGLFGNAAASTVSSAASVGVTAITPEGQNISPGR